MHRNKASAVYHHCDLVKGSDSCLPKLSPQAGTLRRILRRCRKKQLISSNPRSKTIFRSHAAIVAEKKRQIHLHYWHVIHPLSPFCFHFEVFMCIFWILVFFKDPFTTAFYHIDNENILAEPWEIFDLCIDILFLFYIVCNFNIGYLKKETKEVLLSPKKIAIQYVSTYFFFDLIGTIPFSLLLRLIHNDIEELAVAITCTRFLRLARFITLRSYLHNITEFLQINHTIWGTFWLVFLMLYQLHFWACMVYFIPRVHYIHYHELPNTSWVVHAQIEPYRKNVSTGVKYLECFFAVTCNYYRSGVGMHPAALTSEQVAFTLVMLCGAAHFTYIMMRVLQIVRLGSASQSKYEELVHQLDEYMRSKKLPAHLRIRLLMYYENRFEKHYFREQAILSTLSEHLRHEIFLFSCKSLIAGVSIFQNVPRGIVGAVVGCLKHEVYLPNDVVVKAGTPAEAMYFISHGTVAIYSPSGKELEHMVDCEYFGFTSLMRGENPVSLISAVAIEMTELLRLDKRDFRHTILMAEEIGEKFQVVAQEKLARINAVETANQVVFNHRDIVHELRSGRILERGQKCDEMHIAVQTTLNDMT